jgi:hypothetical protein
MAYASGGESTESVLPNSDQGDRSVKRSFGDLKSLYLWFILYEFPQHFEHVGVGALPEGVRAFL